MSRHHSNSNSLVRECAGHARPLNGSRLLAGLLVLNGLALLLVSVWFRVDGVGHIPGVNGDEAWYGVQAVELLRGGSPSWQTPTGNPLNPGFFVPMVLLHSVCPPSIVLLRAVAVLSGLATLAVNAWLCRWVFDRRTAVLSTLVLAVLPVPLAYSRFAWDASQSVLVTLPVLYFSLAAVRFLERQARLLLAAAIAAMAAFLVHPANLFAGLLLVPALLHPETRAAVKRRASGLLGYWPVVLALAAVVGGMLIGWLVWGDSSAALITADRLDGLTQMTEPGYAAAITTLYPRLFLGATVYRYLAGSTSWLQWPYLAGNVWGLDVLLFWPALLAAGWVLWHRSSQLRTDRALIVGAVLQLAAFLLLAGPRALVPGYERYALCLIAPAVLIAARAAVVWCNDRPKRWRCSLVIGSLAGWFLLADFDRHYFHFIEQTGGEAHPTFRTAPVEPKQAALQRILDQRRGEPTWIVTSTWWNYWSLRYMAMGEPEVRVLLPEEAEAATGFSQARRQGRVWYVEFSDSEQARGVRRQLRGAALDEWQIPDYGGRPVLSVLRSRGP